MTGRNNAAMARVKWPCVAPLASHIDGFAGHLAGEGCAPSTIYEKYGVCLVARGMSATLTHVAVSSWLSTFGVQGA